MKEGDDSTGKFVHIDKSGWRFVMQKMQIAEEG